MKKVTIGLALALVLVLAIGTAGYVYAQSTTPGTQTPGFGPGMMQGWAGQGGRGMMGRGGMMGGFAALDEDGHGPMHDTMVSVFAEKLGLTVDELNTRLDAGETMYQIAQSKGYTLEQFQALMQDARGQAIDKAVADGTLTAEQGQWMKDRQQYMFSGGFGAGGCMGTGAAGQGTGATGFRRGPRSVAN